MTVYRMLVFQRYRINLHSGVVQAAVGRRETCDKRRPGGRSRLHKGRDCGQIGNWHTSSSALTMTRVDVHSPEIARASLHRALPWYTHLYTLPFLSLYPLLAYAYYIKYDDWLGGEEWTFLACVSLGAGHALSFLVTKWSTAARAWVTTWKVGLPSAVL